MPARLFGPAGHQTQTQEQIGPEQHEPLFRTTCSAGSCRRAIDPLGRITIPLGQRFRLPSRR